MNTETTAPHIPVQEVESSQIHAIGHDAATNKLAIRFRNKAGEPSSLYYYENVDAETFEAFRSAESVGSFFYKTIKPFPDRFPYQRIEG
ncbi:KTSC domain-containing protein [Burkholderia stagnalis]|uniref:KTSC domain-containing protein n=1 Tax=Burkholderia stagnalis TaxID=1503054 RepID=UPI000F5E85CA|nr:KTSC domain-containing protein [Burkholderia stagnalis]RQZ08932.1 KTSC domain-containing protein [Burkholderia stagnalis]